MWRLARIIMGPAYRAIFRFRVTGKKNIPRTGGVILCANHTSYHDTLVLGISSPRDINFLAKKELFEKKLVSRVLLRLKAIPVDRDKPSMDIMKKVLKLLKDEEAVGIFMQGGRRKDGDADDYKAGVALFAIKGKVPVVPINISSDFRFRSKVHINIGSPISFKEYHGKKVRTEELNTIAQRIMDEIVNLGNYTQK